MREILFKAKRLDNGEWVEGFYMNLGNKYHYILAGKLDITRGYPDFVKYSVAPETICQYTGLTDKNGNKIWENDVVKYEDAEADFEGYHDNVFVNVGKVCMTPQGVFFTNRQTVDMDDLWLSDCSVEAEVIGNIFDNPELLKRGTI